MKGFSSSSSQVFSQKPDQLWNVISSENNLNDAHPFCKTNEIITWTDNDRRDKLVYLNGLTLLESFLSGLKVLDTTYGLAQNVGLGHMWNGE